jgi:4-hydroxymandelate oxidase
MSYLTLGREESKDLMAEAEASGFAALGLTIDSLMPGSSAWSAASSGYDEAPETDAAWTLRAATRTRQNFAARPSDIEWVKENTSLPVVVKGVMGAADAAAAVSAGADAVVVSNHGGRLLDSAQSALEQLPEVVEAVAGNAVVLVDGGIRSGTDVAKAIALGADLTLVGRPICWGLVEGSTGVVKTLQALQAGLERAMIFTGCATIADIGPEILAPASFGHLQSRISGT